jgi:exopolysaccharide biosynthesis polyprenyl glycosylphosphotransferase
VTDIKTRVSLNLLKLLDLATVVLSFGLTTVIIVHEQTSIALSTFLSMRTKISNVLISIAALYLYHLIFKAFGLYGSRRLCTITSEIFDVFRAITFSVICSTILGWLLYIRMFTPAFLFTFWAISVTSIALSRIALRSLLGSIRTRGRNLRNMLIFGTNHRAVAFAQKIMAQPESGYQLLGFVDDEWEGIADFRSSGFQLVCDYRGLAEFLRRNVVEEVVVYLPFQSFYRYWVEVARLCADHGIRVRLNSDVFGLDNARWLAEDVDGSYYIATRTGVWGGGPLAVKRLIDIAISAAVMIFLSPIFLAAAIAVKLSSPGPVIFLQERIGLNKRRFKIWKFRTMVQNAEKLQAALEGRNEVSGPVFKIKDDPRITPIGKFLRRSSIDELPQLINVLKGDMSLVGPRPLPVRDYEGFNEDWQRRRFSVKPGITCLWQVNGRSGISFDQWMMLDLKYMDEWSLWLDLKILAQTVPAVMRGSGAA